MHTASQRCLTATHPHPRPQPYARTHTPSACLPAGGAQGGDAIAQLEAALRPVERYAVRFVEVEAPRLDKDQLAAQVGGRSVMCRAGKGLPGWLDGCLAAWMDGAN